MPENALIPAIPQQYKEGAELALLAGEQLIPAIFGPKALSFWEKAFCHPKCGFSYEHSWFLDFDGKPVGIAVGYDYISQKKEEFRTFLILLKCLKWTFIKQRNELRQSGNIMAKTSEGDYYLSNLALYPQFRGQGYGTMIMDSVEKMAAEDGCTRVVLDAEATKDRTLQFYKRRGYEMDEALPVLKTKAGDFELCRMIKKLK